MIVVSEITALRQQITNWKKAGDCIAFVPTMGNLHEGHLALVKAAKNASTTQVIRVIVSIFVNPKQFSPDEDFSTYPRTFDSDVNKLADLSVDLVFSPAAESIYPSGEQNCAYVDLPALSSIVEGESRPGFFKGVATIVNKLFNLVQPDLAYFGEKDYQQLLVIKQMVADLSMPVEVKSVPTVRESDGLAMSSRNQYLTTEQRQKAVLVSESMRLLHDNLSQDVDLVDAEYQAKQLLIDAGFDVDYLCVKDAVTLLSPKKNRLNNADSYRILVAARIGTTRLIDNMPYEP